MKWCNGGTVDQGEEAYDNNLVKAVVESNYFYQGKPDSFGAALGPYNSLLDGDIDLNKLTVEDMLAPVCQTEQSECDRFTIHRLKLVIIFNWEW